MAVHLDDNNDPCALSLTGFVVSFMTLANFIGYRIVVKDVVCS